MGSIPRCCGGRIRRGSRWIIKKELQEIIDQVESAKNRLAEVTEAMDFDDREVDSLDEALDALDDAIDIMTDTLEEEE